MFVIDIMNDGVPRHVLEYRWNGVGERDIFARNIVTDAAGNPDHEFAERARFKEISGEIRIFNGATHVFNPLESEIAKRNYLMIYRPGDLGYPRSSLGELCRFYVVHPGTKRAKP
jgi:hypothetical protein